MQPEGNPLDYHEVIVVQILDNETISLNRATSKKPSQPPQVLAQDKAIGATHFIVDKEDLRKFFELAKLDPQQIVRNQNLYEYAP
jgi:hypothetical protein